MALLATTSPRTLSRTKPISMQRAAVKASTRAIRWLVISALGQGYRVRVEGDLRVKVIRWPTRI
jgi:hypothetical protein